MSALKSVVRKYSRAVSALSRRPQALSLGPIWKPKVPTEIRELIILAAGRAPLLSAPKPVFTI